MFTQISNAANNTAITTTSNPGPQTTTSEAHDTLVTSTHTPASTGAPQTQTTTSAPLPPAPAPINIEGTYNSTFGSMTLTRAGGSYIYSNGKIRITSISGAAVEGVWEQDRSSQRCADGRYYGRFQLQFTQEGFTGSYGYCDGAVTGGVWNGTRSDCRSGYVWREAFSSDRVCVMPESHTRALQDNAAATQRVDRTGVYGANTCVSGYVWRQAYAGDVVCVTPQTRQQTLTENNEAALHAN